MIIHKYPIRLFLFIGVVSFFFLATGCSMKMGTFAEKTHFSFPNSNIKPLGQVSASMEKTGFIFPPVVTADDIRNLLENALGQKPGADLVINYKTDTEFSFIPIPILSFYTVKTTLTGTAVSMEIGMQELLEKLNY